MNSQESANKDNNETYATFLKSNRPIRKWNVWPGKTSFFCNAHCVKGHGKGHFIGANMVLFIPPIIYFALCFALVRGYARIGIEVAFPLCVVVVFILMFKTAFTNPGIVERYSTPYFVYVCM